MPRKSLKTGIILGMLAIALLTGYIAYQAALSPSRRQSGQPPVGRAFTVRKINMPIGISGVGIVSKTPGSQVVVGVKEWDVKRVSLGQNSGIWIRAVSKTFNGKVSNIGSSSKLTDNQPVYDVTVSIDDTNDELKDGMTADVLIVLDVKNDVLAIPVLSIQNRENSRPFVWVLPASWTEAQGDKIRPELREIKTGAMDQRNAEVISGLNEWEKVIVPTNQK